MSNPKSGRPARLLGGAVVLALGLLVSLTVAVAAPSSAAPAKRSISFAVSATPVTSGTGVTLSGRLTRSPKRSLVLIERRSGKSWKKVATSRTTSAKGTFTYTLRTAGHGTTSYRARAPKTSKARQAVSATRMVVVDQASTATLIASTTTPAAGDPVTFVGRAQPSTGGTPVTLERLIGGVWRSDGATTVTDSAGNFAFSRAAQSGTWQYRAAVSRSSAYIAAATTPTVTLAVSGPTSLEVQVINLPTGVSPDITVTAPGGSVSTIHGTTTFARAAVGEWRIHGASVAADGGDLWPSVNDLVAVVTHGQSALTVLDYSVLVPETTEVLAPGSVSDLVTTPTTATMTTARAGELAPGDVVAVGVGDTTPYGVLGKVTGITGSQVSLDTDDVTLMDAVATGMADVSVPLGAEDVLDPGTVTPDPIQVDAQPGMVSAGPARLAAQAAPKESLARRLLKSLSCEAGAQASVEADVDFSTSVNFTADWNLVDGLQSASLTAEAKQTAKILASVSGSASCKLDRTGLLAQPIVFNPITFSVGPVPVVLVPQLQFFLDAQAGVEAKVYTGAVQTLTATAGVRYAKAAGFSPVQSLTNTVTQIPPTFEGKAHAEAGVAPEVKILLYGLAGPRVYVRGSVEADATAAATLDAAQLDWVVNLRLQGAAALDVDVLDLHSGELELFNTTWDVARGSVAYTPPDPTDPDPTDPPSSFEGCPEQSAVPVAECDALIGLMTANQTTWKRSDWGVGAQVCEWTGVTCEAGHVVGLDAYDAGITTVPATIGDLQQLRLLSFGRNNIARLPDSIGSLTTLTMLDLTMAGLSELPDSVGNLDNLETLSLREDGHLNAVPESVGDLSKLTDLDLRGTSQAVYPESLGRLTQLRRLDLSYNNYHLTTVPDWVKNLTGLTDLQLGSNRLTTVPIWISDLVELRTLSLDFTDIAGDITSWAKPLSVKAVNLERLYLQNYLCKDTGGDTELQAWLDAKDPKRTGDCW